MHLLLADRFPDQAVAALEARGHTCVLEPGLTGDELPAAIAGFEGLVVRSTPVGRAVFEAADRLALLVRAGSGTDAIDTEAASRHGVAVCNVPGRNAAAVAELTLGLLLAIDRRIPDNVVDLRSGHWDKSRYSTAAGLFGSTMAVIGLGSVGLAVAERAAAFGIRLQSLDKPRGAAARDRIEELGITLRSTMPELLSAADIVTLHVPASEETHHLVDSTFLARMRPGAILLNTSRGDVVDEKALLEALDAGRVRAGLDVFADEPATGSAIWDSPLARHPAVVATHHIGASTRQAQRAIADEVVEIVDAFAAGRELSCVNPDRDGAPRSRRKHPARVVRPFAARLVQPEWAPRAVTAMYDPLDESGSEPPRIASTAAYDDSGEALYVYRQQDGRSSYAGVVCEVDIQAFANGQVRGHEAVHAHRVEALLHHYATTNAPPALVSLIHRAGPAFLRALDKTQGTPAVLDFTGPGGLHQTVWRLPEPTDALTDELAATRHYIADGHHRVTAALQEWRHAGHPRDTGVLCVVHAMDGLNLSAFHRRIAGPLAPQSLLDLLAPEFEARPVPRRPTPAPGSFGLYLAGGWFEVSFHGSREAGPAGLDAAILQARVVDSRTQSVEISATRASVDDLVHQCDVDGGALFTLAPPTLDELTDLADAGALMPPKTTYFSPKPCAGIFLRQ
jgi:D-3-phosphoglycerate dehydrogenase